MKFNLTEGAGINLPGSDIITVICDGPAGPATSMAIWLSKEIADAGNPPAIRIDFDNPTDLLSFCSLNFEMAKTVMTGLFNLGVCNKRPKDGGH